ncbi:MAG: GIY-YIG nuclease family protein [Patescibacteria group bacterium]
MKAFVYILRDAHGKFYIGSTTDLKRRLRQHQLGHTRTTRNMTSPELVHSQEYAALLEARKIERRLKNLKRKDYIARIIQDGNIKMT